MLMRFDPFREMDSLSQAFAAAQGMNRGMPMAMDAYRDGDRVIVQLDVPGVEPGSIDLTVEKNVLTVTAERRWEPAEGQEVLVSERRQGKFSRQLFLGDSLDMDRIDANYDRGVLTLIIPVAEQAKPRHVQITTGDTGQPIETTARTQSSTQGSAQQEMAGSTS